MKLNLTVPPGFMPSYLKIAVSTIALSVVAICQGADYIIRPNDSVVSVSILEGRLPLTVWGLGLVGFGLLSLLGGMFSIWPVTIIGNGGNVVIYSALGTSAFLSLLVDARIYGWGMGVDYFYFALLHWTIADGSYNQWSQEWSLDAKERQDG